MRHSCERYKKAKYGSKDAVDRIQISRMLSFLHGRINGKDKNKSSEASEAKSIYQNLQDPTEKNRSSTSSWPMAVEKCRVSEVCW